MGKRFVKGFKGSLGLVIFLLIVALVSLGALIQSSPAALAQSPSELVSQLLAKNDAVLGRDRIVSQSPLQAPSPALSTDPQPSDSQPSDSQTSDSQTSDSQTSDSQPSDPQPSNIGDPADRLLPDQWPARWPEQWTNPWAISSDTIDSAPIYLDGRPIFEVAAPVVPGQAPAESRARNIQSRLNALVARLLEAEGAIEVAFSIDQPSNLPVITVNGEQLMTVTELDAQLAGHLSPINYAAELADRLQSDLARARQERQPEFVRRQMQIALGSLLAASCAQLGARRLARRLNRRYLRLSKLRNKIGQAPRITPRPPDALLPIYQHLPYSIFALLKARLANRKKRQLNDAARGFLILLQIALWMSTVIWILSLFPMSRWLSTLSLQWLKIPAKIFLATGIAVAVLRLSSLLIDRVSLALQEGTQWAPEKSPRLSLRFSTFSQVAKGLIGSAILAVNALVVLAISGIQVAPLLAGAGIIGLGISLAAQSLIKDFINGFLILLEDQFGIGDVITVGGLTGKVESLNLRITQIRDTEGRLITIPNSQIGIVENASKDWAQVDLSVSVAANTNIDQALAIMRETTLALAQEEAWKQSILEPPDLLGIDQLDYSGITLRLFLKTQPLQQWPVARELRRRIKQAFDAADIAMGIGAEKLAFHWEGEPPKPQDSDSNPSNHE